MERPEALADGLRRFAAEHELLEAGQGLVVGVSGGVDSMALLDLLRHHRPGPVVVHVDHRLRPDSGSDAAFVREQAEEWGLEFVLVRVEAGEAVRAEGGSVQAVARRLRYEALAGVARERDLHRVAVAHHADDQVETVLLHLFRGTGIRGMAGMPPRRVLDQEGAVELVRPLLWARRTQIVAHARSRGLAWREDPGNADPTYRRASVRHRVLPLLREVFGEGVDDAVLRNALLAGQMVERLGAVLGLDDVRDPGHDRSLLLARLEEVPAWMRRRLLLDALARWLPDAPRTFAVAGQLDRLVESQPGRRVDFSAGAVWRERERLLFVPSRHVGAGGGGSVRVDPVDVAEVVYDDDPHTEYADLDRLGDSLEVRPWREGDRFRPLGGRGSRRVSRFLADARVPSAGKRGVHVLTARGEIAWVIGFRLDDRFRITDGSRRAARLTYVPAP